MTLKLVLNKQEIIDCVKEFYNNNVLPDIHGRHYEADFSGHYGLYEITIASVADKPAEPAEPVSSSVEVTEERV
jgi:hypothetical protein